MDLRSREHLEIASGYLELGMLEDATAELEKINSREGSSSDVMSFKFRLYSAAEQ